MTQDTQTPQQPQWVYWMNTGEASRCQSRYEAKSWRCELRVGHPTDLPHRYDGMTWPLSDKETITHLEGALREAATYEASLRRDLESLRMRFADSISRHNVEKAALQERIELMEAANVSEELWESQRIETLTTKLREAEAAAALADEVYLRRWGRCNHDEGDGEYPNTCPWCKWKQSYRTLQQPKAGA